MSHGSRYPRAAAQALCAIVTAALQLAVAAPAAAQGAQQTPEEPSPDAQGDDGRKWFVMEDRPSLRLGDRLRLDLTSKLDLSIRGGRDVDSDAHMGQRRIGVE